MEEGGDLSGGWAGRVCMCGCVTSLAYVTVASQLISLGESAWEGEEEGKGDGEEGRRGSR